MKRELEDYLRARIRRCGKDGETPREVIAAMKMQGMIQNEKQAYATLAKWSRKGIYGSGVTLDLGWINE